MKIVESGRPSEWRAVARLDGQELAGPRHVLIAAVLLFFAQPAWDETIMGRAPVIDSDTLEP
jgi:hypothetical protein